MKLQGTLARSTTTGRSLSTAGRYVCAYRTGGLGAARGVAIRCTDAQSSRSESFQGEPPLHLKTDFLLANPIFNRFDWGGERLRDDERWRHGTRPAGNAKFESDR